ncbi:hypothetical protein DYB32_005170 [Aphanomyces invadans]|uniref:Glycosyltransferase 2-like domain-containing protein n=1 Tax=Aphanomyces invadans TaxID=157072 RepID=A0A3R6ZPX5_9STRA|nr:hypothetical protein DYB32_005170 [Aphanomyces invadans]
MSTLIQSRSSVLFESDASTVASVMDDWNRCFHTILAMPPPPRPTPASTVAIPFGFRLQLFGQLSVEVVMHANETPTQVGATIAALYGLEPLYQCYIQTLLFHGVQRWRQNEAQLAITTDAFPGRTPPLDIYVGDDVALAVQYHLWRYNHRVPGRDVAVAVASIRHKLAFSDASAPWIAARGVQHQPPRSAVQAHDAPQLSTRQCLTVALTTCKRLSLFLATMKSFLPYANSTAVAICMILVLDDHSSAADRRVMQESFPTVQFVFTRRKGHAHSLNLLLDLVSTPFVLYLEDDWQWLQDLPHHPIAHALAVLDSDPTLVQVLLNTQFSGWPRTMHDSHPFDVYFRHEFGIVDHAFGYWPGFSLNPGVWNLRRLRQCPRLTFNERSDVFEREFSLAVWQCGLHVAMLPYTTAVHIGAAPGTNGSAYALNGMPRRFD